MSQSIGNMIADSMEMELRYANSLVAGVTAEQFARFATPGGELIESNHPSFCLGHLTLYAIRMLDQMGKPTAEFGVCEKYATAYSKDAKCVDDADGSVYPPMDEVMGKFNACYNAAVEALREVSDETLQGENPAGGRLTELFPTLGSVFGFYSGGHMMVHLGQMSAWRRMMGLGAA